jgi:hypothetical protein
MIRPVAGSQQDTEVSKALLLALFLDPTFNLQGLVCKILNSMGVVMEPHNIPLA